MKISTWIQRGAILGLAALTTSLAAGRTGLPADGPIQEGDVASYTFRSPLVNGLGMKSLEDLRGKPVFVEFWGTR